MRRFLLLFLFFNAFGARGIPISNLDRTAIEYPARIASLNSLSDDVLKNIEHIDDLDFDVFLAVTDDLILETKGDNLIAFFNNHPEGVRAWDIIRKNIDNFGKNTTKFAFDESVLNKVADMMLDGSVFRNKMIEMGKNWEATLGDILKAAKKNPCNTCGKTFMKGTFKLHKYLEDMEYYLTHFTDMPGANKLNHWVLGRNVNGDVVSNRNWLEINQTIDYLKRHQIHTKTDIEFGKLFQQGNTSKSCDIYYKEGTIEKFVELKNVDFTNIDDLSILNTGATSMQRINQVIGPKGAFSRINNLNEYEWVATALKNDDITHLKNLWKQAFIDNAEDMFNNLGQAKMQQLFGMDNAFNIDNYSTFQTLLNNNTTFRNNVLKFIKIE